MSEQSDDIIKNIDAFYEKVKEDDKKSINFIIYSKLVI